MLGGFLAICSAASFAFNNASVRRAVLTGSIVQGMAITVPIGVPLFFVAALITGNLGAVCGLLADLARCAVGRRHHAFRLGPLLQLPRHPRHGHEPRRAGAAVQSAGDAGDRDLAARRISHAAEDPRHRADPARTDLHAVGRGQGAAPDERPVSDEKITPIDAEKPAAFQPKYAEGYMFALLSATGYGVSPILVRVGLENQGLGVSLAGGLVAYIAATALFTLVLLWPGQWRHVRAIDREAAKWFTFSGFLVFFSQMFLYMALSIAPVTVVSPINRLSILFRLYFSRLLNPKHEVFGGSVIWATVVSLLGALALTHQHRRGAVAAAAAGGRAGVPQLAVAVTRSGG